MKVSILIGSRDRIEVLAHCLQSVLTQQYKPLEVLILDDNSSQYYLEEQLAPKFQDERLRWFRSDKSLGVAGGRNFLMGQATGDIFCVIDDDACFADNSCVAQLVEALICYPKVGILATRIINHGVDQTTFLLPFSQQWRKKRPELLSERCLVSYYLGGGHGLRRSVIECCGDYQADLMFGEEELDLSYRSIEMGFEIMYLPEVVVHHYPQPSVIGDNGANGPSELYYHVRNRFFISYKYLPAFYIPIYLAAWLTTYGLRALKLGTFGEFLSGIKAGMKLRKTLKRTPLSPQAIKYLKTYYGRLWY
jgi:GT2 family glycosyltransferase